jgi:hypothetical protein
VLNSIKFPRSGDKLEITLAKLTAASTEIGLEIFKQICGNSVGNGCGKLLKHLDF